MALYALVNDETQAIENVIEWDGVTEYTPDLGFSVHPLPEGQWIGQVYTP